MESKLTRREFIKMSSVAAVGLAIAACTKTEEPTKAPEPTQATKQEATATPVPVVEPEAKEAPMLADLVKAGSLPELNERLPSNPGVFATVDGIGKHGGTLRRGFKGVSDRWGPTKLHDRALVWFDKDLVQVPRMAESWEVSDDATTWTFHMRKGVKWSDGEPFDSNAIKWRIENEYFNTTLTPSPGTFVTGAEKTQAEHLFPDEYTWTVKFAAPNAVFILGRGRADYWYPGHYLKQYHMELTDDKAALEKEVTDKGFDGWTSYWSGDRTMWYLNPDMPRVSGWLAKGQLSLELFPMERNPYFFATDSEGQQLPYIDSVTHRLFADQSVFNMWIVNGEIDFQNRHVQIGDYTLHKENEANGDYQVFLGVSAGHVCVNCNHTTKEPRLREFIQDRNVRIALSLAVDRDELNELVYDGLLTPRQYSPISMSPQAYAKQANAYVEYDPDKANDLLDEAGYSEKDAEGFRLWKDGSGETLSFTIEGTDTPGTQGEDAIQRIVQFYTKVGIKCAYKGVERSLYQEHYAANEIEMAYWGGDRTVLPLVAPIIWTCRQPDRPWGAAWALWDANHDNPNGEEPPAGHWVWTIWELWDKIVAEPDPDKQTALFHQILDIWAEELPQIGYLGESPAPIIVKNGFRGYLPGFPVDDPTGDEHLLQTETYYWENPEEHTS
ncbi:MAG: ABC transporter substrate-binding protein [Anaerolineae bacterium]|nr:ABC transporter substrate-binding protein [Anaerolineae bacterium]